MSAVPPAINRQKSSWVLQDETDDIHKHYQLGEQIGAAGQFGYAVVAKHRATGQLRAVKVLSKAKFSRASDKKVYFEELRGEIEIMRKMDHPNVIKLYDVFETPSELFIVMELCTGGELFDRIKAQPQGQYNEKKAAVILKQIAEAMNYLHKNKIAHCDLKPDNFLFKDNSDESLKVIDFGMSKFVKRRKYFTSLRGTPYYIAPEVVQGRYNEACDMWSFGVVTFVMLFGFPPFHGDDDEAIFKAVVNGFSPVTKNGFGAFFPAAIPCSDVAKDLIAKCLVLDTAKRLTAEEVLEHPFLRGSASSAPMASLVLDKLKSFSGINKFKNGVLHMMTSTMTETELQDLKKIFQSIDENGDGQITVNELAKAMEKSGSAANLQEIMDLMKAADADGNGCLSYNELVMTSLQKKLCAKEERLWNAFCKVDLNGDGKITVNEIEQVLKLDHASAKKLISEIDVNGDGEVDFDEFITMWIASGRDDTSLSKEFQEQKSNQ